MPISEVYNMDCMEYMKTLPDKAFQLAIVDPPYGIGNRLVDGGGGRGAKFDNNRKAIAWDSHIPDKKYFDELFRVSCNQIIWGGNYFIENLKNTQCIIIWDKMQEFSGSDFELAWTSFCFSSKTFRMSRIEAYRCGKIHPTQKPVKLYEWLLMNYAKEGDKILDTHLGSGSSRIAAYKLGFEFVGCELDKDYFEAQEKRFRTETMQQSLFV